MFDLESALHRVIEIDGSDLHLKVPSRPLIRRLGHLEEIPDTDELAPEDTERALRELLHDHGKLEEFAEEHEVDFSYSMAGLSRLPARCPTRSARSSSSASPR
jgi:twitching motility protein PilT